MTSSTTTPEASTTLTPEMMTSTTTTTATTGIGIITPFCNEAPPGSDCSTTDNGKVDGCCDDVRQCLPKIDGPEDKFRAKIREKLRGNGRRNQYKKANIDSGDSPSRPRNGGKGNRKKRNNVFRSNRSSGSKDKGGNSRRSLLHRNSEDATESNAI